jgi:hypothetical protein
MIPTAAAVPALDSFETEIPDRLDHPAFKKFGSVVVTAEEARGWAEAWALDRVTKAEIEVMIDMLFGSSAPECRQLGGQLMLRVAKHVSSKDVDLLRSAMAGAPSDFAPPESLRDIWHSWRRIQVRQLFRLSLEALFYWTIVNLDGKPKSIEGLVGTFLDQVSPRPKETRARDWLDANRPSSTGPTELMERIQQALNVPFLVGLPVTIAAALAFCLAEAPQGEGIFERPDRLPLIRAQRETTARENVAIKDFVRHVFESWVLAQHTYWSVGRGLADARARGKTLLRLRIILDEGGWTLTPGASHGSPPLPTPDRLQTAVSLARECNIFDLAPASKLPAQKKRAPSR